MSKGNLNTYGNKKSNFPFQQSVLLMLDTIIKALGGSSTVITRTPSILRATGAGSVAAGAQAASIYNSGLVAGTVNGIALNPGERIGFSVENTSEKLDVIAYDGTGTNFLITTLI